MPKKISDLLSSAQAAELKGDFSEASKLYRQYYLNRPFQNQYTPSAAFGRKKKSPPRLSIIVPCHNSEKYIGQCIDSILAQEFSDFELIIVEDGSSDMSLSIILDKALSDDRIVVLKNDIPSGSAGLPRNQALDIAKGDLVGFVDSDDWIDPSYFKSLVDTIEQNNADLAISSGFINHEENQAKTKYYNKNWRIKTNDPNLACTHMSSMIWDKVYRRDLLKQNDIYLGPYPAAVDVPFIIKCYYYCKIPAISGTRGYHYRREAENSVTVKFRKGTSCDFELKAYEDIFDWSKRNNVPDSYLNFMYLKRLASLIYSCRLIKINYLNSYFEKSRKLLLESDSPSMHNIICLSSDENLKKNFQLFSNSDIRGFVELNRKPDLSYFIENSKNNKYNLAGSIYPAPKNQLAATRNLVFFPDWSYSNPYQRLFYQNMQGNMSTSDINVIGLKVDEVCKQNIFKLISSGDIVHIHWVHPFISTDKDAKNFCEILKSLKSEKSALIVWTVHNTVSHECTNDGEEIKRRKWVADQCDRFIVHSNHASSELINFYGVLPDRVYVFPHGKYPVNPEKIYKSITASSIKRQKMRLTILGDLRLYKNVKWAAKFIQNINQNLDSKEQIELRIAGKAISEEQSNFLYDFAVHNKFISLHLKRLTNEELFQEFCSTDFVFLPYTKILTSGICLNSISHGRPYIAPKFPSLVDINSQDRSFLYENHDELGEMLLQYNKYFHRGLLRLLFDPKTIISGSTDLEWHNIFAQLPRNPFIFA